MSRSLSLPELVFVLFSSYSRSSRRSDVVYEKNIYVVRIFMFFSLGIFTDASQFNLLSLSFLSLLLFLSRNGESGYTVYSSTDNLGCIGNKGIMEYPRRYGSVLLFY